MSTYLLSFSTTAKQRSLFFYVISLDIPKLFLFILSSKFIVLQFIFLFFCKKIVYLKALYRRVQNQPLPLTGVLKVIRAFFPYTWTGYLAAPNNNKAGRLDFCIRILLHFSFRLIFMPIHRAASAQLLSHSNRRLIWQTQ
jgi:hypothetical protein